MNDTNKNKNREINKNSSIYLTSANHSTIKQTLCPPSCPAPIVTTLNPMIASNGVFVCPDRTRETAVQLQC